MSDPAHRPRRVLIVGGDARSDALAAVCQAAGGVELFACSQLANPGLLARCADVRLGDPTDPAGVVAFAGEVGAELAIVGPEAPLAHGVVDALEDAGVACFGPRQVVARVESSKSWARRLLAAHAIDANPAFAVIDDPAAVHGALAGRDEFVLKPDGLTGGKGVRVYPEHFDNFDEAVAYGQECAGGGGLLVVEERMEGEEFSLMTITDGTSFVHCPAVQDHKRAYEGDTGPNTGGMGSYSCADGSLPFLAPSDLAAARAVNESVVAALAAETGVTYRGVLYGGFMATAEGVRVVEYNCRFGDPEVLNLLTLFEGDFVSVAAGVATGTLAGVAAGFAPKASVCKYVVPEGYPTGGGKGDPIAVPGGTSDGGDVRWYWAATERLPDGTVAMTGSRALGVVALGDTLASAEVAAEAAASAVEGPVRHRRDIGTETLVARRIAHMAELR